jgi:general secretion pathway protein G
MTLHWRTQLSRRSMALCRRAFTLIEVLLVLAIMGLIMSMVIPKVMGRQRHANEDATRISLHGLEQSIRMYALDHGGSIPSARDGIQVLLSPPTRKDVRWRGPYLEKQAVDAWGEPLRYVYPGKVHPSSYDVFSLGEDRIEGTQDDIILQ